MIAKLRTGLFWGHLAVGIVAGLFILNMAVSGVLIAYQRQITAWAEHTQRRVDAPPPGTPRLGVEALAARAQEARPDARLSGVTLSADPTASAMFGVGREDGALFVNPYTGEVRGQDNKAVRGFFRWVTGWHRWLAREGPSREAGKAVTGAASLAYFALLLSGLCLWLPRRWSRANLRPITLLRRGLRGRARDWNWHNVVGLWCAPLLLFVTLTGIIMAYPWANNLLFTLTNSPLPEQRREGSPREGGGKPGVGAVKGEERPAPLDLKGYDAMWAQAEGRVAGWRSISVRLAPNPRAPVTFTIDRGDGGRPDLKAQLTFDRQTGAVTRWLPYADQSTGQKLRFWARFVHTGEAGGWWGETIAVVSACGGILLVWTGLSLAWRRFFGRWKPLGEEAAPPAVVPLE